MFNSISWPANRRESVALIPIVLFVGAAGAPASNTYLSDEFANISPMPGGGWALNALGEIRGDGAFQVNIPVAYTPKAEYIVGSAYFGGSPSDPNSFVNKTGIVGVSVGGFPRLWLSGMFKRTSTANVQLQLTRETDYVPVVSVGAQNLTDSGNTRLGHIVLTKGFGPGGRLVHATAGLRANTGNVRGIAGVSAPIGDYFNAAIEWDGLQTNTGIIVRPTGIDSRLTLLGAYKGHSGWLAGISINLNWSRFISVSGQ